MNKRYAWFTSVLVNLLLVSAINGQSKITVFTSGTEGYQSFRIPAIVSFQKTLLAFAEGRVKGAADFGDINIVLKKSTDNGKTWTDLSVVASNGHLQAGNPAPVVDLTDPNYPNGRIFLFYNTGNQSEGDIRKGKGMREVWYKTSVDAGNTWSDPVNITLQVHRPNQPSINPAFHFSEDWRSYANTPGHAMQFDEGKYKGRIFVAANHSQGNPVGKFEDYFSHGFYTDNHGVSFQLSPSLNLPGSNEATATQISNNRLLLNARNQKGDIRARIIAISNSGGAHWDTLYFKKK
jgi:sialidase-1